MTVQRIQLDIHRLQQHQPLWADCRAIRQSVFIDEQQVPVALEWDAADATATHLLACLDGQSLACARVLPDGHIGRMAVLAAWRGRGVGEALLLQAIQVCRQLGVSHARLSAQTHAVGFYQQAGFEVCSPPYLDANILHVDMELKLV
ncbi:GNAT family N-acetyltransferase [Methylophilus medardicus]|uniref:GNAT family N-acetyltransferase n=1 Tax=Methylophilus medardicus TaxID=2588534 RepID=A0A5B8CQ06_9PROT|nr:GNAT family N-acetyltransferase [Methylophilus medardicus]QDC43277.1 GNAT family N-acetyltransferase [Methylophilus medardicus]QDC48284.1 GNAT family N-acetyltransferase [Methylophilus medardicus]QDC51989.1 GNAT family N-acetyltransferase [Methylophilus medardicus]